MRAPIFPFYCYELYFSLEKNRWISPCLFCTRNKTARFSRRSHWLVPVGSKDNRKENSQSFCFGWNFRFDASLRTPCRLFSRIFVVMFYPSGRVAFIQFTKGVKLAPILYPSLWLQLSEELSTWSPIIKQYPVACFLNWVPCAIFLDSPAACFHIFLIKIPAVLISRYEIRALYK